MLRMVLRGVFKSCEVLATMISDICSTDLRYSPFTKSEISLIKISLHCSSSNKTV